MNYYADPSQDECANRPRDKLLSPDFIKKWFHPLQRPKLRDRFGRERKCYPYEIQARYDRLQNKRHRPVFCEQLMVLALFGPPGAWDHAVMNHAEKPPIPSEEAAQVDEAAFEGKRRRNREWYYLWELEEMFGRKEAHELIEKGQLKKKTNNKWGRYVSDQTSV